MHRKQRETQSSTEGDVKRIISQTGTDSRQRGADIYVQNLHSRQNSSECVQGYLDERQRLLSAADQRRFLLLLLLHDGSKGHQGGEGRAACCAQHPRPEGRHAGWVSLVYTQSNGDLLRTTPSAPALFRVAKAIFSN